METKDKTIVKMVKEDIDFFNDGELITTYYEITYVVKQVRTITEKEYYNNIDKW